MLRVDIQKKLGKFNLNAAFEAEAGVTGILGASGCGKSMTLSCIAGIERPDKGRIVLDGVTLFDSDKGIDVAPQRRKVGYLFQSYALFPHMTVEKNILLGLHYEKDMEKRKHALEDVMRLLQLEGLEKHRPAQISGGQAQRVALARILVNRPKLLMLDEPFSALDSHLRSQLEIQMKKLLKQYDGIVLMVTHDRDEAYHLCRQIAVMDSGALLAAKPTKALFSNPGTISGAVITGCKNIAFALKTGEYELEVPSWGVRLTTEKALREDVCAVAIRAHSFDVEIPHNRFSIHQTDEMEEPFEWLVQFRCENQKEGTPNVWWRMPKDRKPKQMPSAIGVSPANVLPLYAESFNLGDLP